MDFKHLNWEGRINNIRFDFAGFDNFGVEGKNTFEIVGIGAFATTDGAVNYVKAMGLNTEMLETGLPGVCDHFDFDEDGICDICDGVIPEDPVEPPVGGEVTTEEAGNEVTTEAPAGEVTTEEGETSGSEEETTKKPAATTAAASSDEGEEETKKGCGSVVSMGAIAIVAIVGTGLVIKKKED